MLVKEPVLIAAAAALLASGCGKKDPAPPAAESLVAPERAALYTTATQQYGQLTVSEGDFEAEASIKPWSGYWFPFGDDILVRDSGAGEAPLKKYDEYASAAFGKSTHAVSYEIDHQLYDPAADGWEGRCNAWAIASISEPEPRLAQPVTLSGVKFGVRDLKALITKSYELTEKLPQFGQRYNGEPGDDWNDIYPDQFHTVLQAELFDRHRPFIIDTDPGVEVWNTPVYKAETRLSRDASDPHVMHVDTSVLGASEFVDPDYVGTKPILYEYTYDLYGLPRSDGGFDVKWGVWTGDSATKAHPDFVTVLPDHPVRHSSANKELDEAIIADLLSRARAGG